MSEQITATVSDISEDRFYDSLVDIIEHNLSLHDIDDNIYRVNVESATGKSLFQHYLALFPEDVRHQYDCRTCERWLNKYGQYVTLSNGLVKSMAFDIDIEAEGEANSNAYAFVKEMNRIISRCPVSDIVVENVADYSLPHSGKFRHFNGTLKCASKELIFVYSNDEERLGKEAVGRELVRILTAGLNRWKTDTVQRAHELFEYGELKTSGKFANQFKTWYKLYSEYHGTKNNNIKNNLVWEAMDFNNKDIIHFHTTAVGVLLDDIADGSERYAISRFLESTKGTNYMRATEAPTEQQLEKAKQLVVDLGIESAFKRRFGTVDDVQEWVWRPTAVEAAAATETKSIFDDLKARDGKGTDEKRIVSGGELSLMRFIAEVLPNAKALRMEFIQPYSSRYNFAQLVERAVEDAKPIYRWDNAEKRNSVSYYCYHEGTTVKRWMESPANTVDVTGIMLSPSVWGGKETYQYGVPDNGMFFVLKGFKDSGALQSALFASDLTHELRDVRSVVEAYSKNNPLLPAEGEAAAGLIIPGNTGVEIYRSTGPFALIAELNDGTTVRYTLGRHF